MKILALADQESKALWDYYDPGRLEGVDCIVSCGDLDPAYLEFLVTMANCPVLYVKGNHDMKYLAKPPAGCIDLDDRVVRIGGIRFAGLGGCMKYSSSPFQFTEREMAKRVKKLHTRAVLANGIDILVTHAPACGMGDMEDLPHRGYDCFHDLLWRWRPSYMLHGHVHRTYGGEFLRTCEHPCGTHVVNAYESFALETGAAGARSLLDRIRPLGRMQGTRRELKGGA